MTTLEETRAADHRRLDPLSGGAEMGQLMRSIDWSATSVGPVESWPQSLRTALSMLLENHFAMYIAWGRDYTQFYNDAFRPILGSTKHPQAMGLAASETFAESWHIIRPMFDGVMQGTAVGSDNWMLPLDRHGFLEECYFNFSYSPIRDETGDVGGVLVTVAETTARVIGERRLHLLQALASRTQEVTTVAAACEVIAKVLEETPSEVPFSALYLLEEEGTIARLACGADVGGVAPPSRIDLDGEQVPWSLDEVVRTGSSVLIGDVRHSPTAAGEPSGGDRIYVMPISPSGVERPNGILVAATSPRLPFDDRYRGFLDVVASQIATTLGSVRSLEEARARADALAELDRAKTTFFSNVSHEFRTPLTLLLGPTEDALSDPSPPRPTDVERWPLVHRNALRLLKLVNTLLDFSRIEAGRIEASYQLTDLTEYTRDLASVFRSAVERAGLSLELHLEPLASPVYVDHDMWEKVVFNLLSNALKFTFTGAIEVSLSNSEGAAILTVRDSGVGIPAAELPFLFDRFHRVQNTRGRTQEGTGIGLALIRELVKLHGGSVEIASVESEGTTFTIMVPFGDAHLPPEQVTRAPRGASTAIRADAFVSDAERWLPESAVSRGGSPAGSTARILLADDNADMRDYVARLLRERWTVEAVPDGATALASIRERPPDLVLTDLMMPGLSGFELLQQLRADPRYRAIPVIFLSARAGEEARVEGLQAGADDYLAKPFSARELLARVTTHLELSRLRREGERARLRMHEQFMQAPVAVAVVLGPRFLFELANPPYEEMVGRRGLAGKTLRQVFPELPDDAPVLRMLQSVYETGEPFHAEEFLVQLDRGRNGVLVDTYFMFTTQALRNEAGHIEGSITVAVEVTEQVRARRQVESQATELDRLNRSKDEFLATLSHELRTPLTSILGWARLLRMEERDEEMRRTGLESIDASARIQARLIDDVLDLSRITTGKVYVAREAVNLADVAAEAIEGVRLAAAAKNIGLDATFPAHRDVARTLGDASRLRQIIWNLLTNAIKFTPEGGHVRLTVEESATSVSLTVEDSGIGIPADFVAHVFEPFRQADSSATRSYGGLGLGLSIVRHLTELHGGRVTAASAGQGQGATFRVELPLLKEQPVNGGRPAALAGPPAENVDRTVVDLRGVSVLVVDDQEAVSAYFSATLRRTGADVRAATSVKEGIAAVETRLPDVVLCDIAMPNEDGFAFLSWMQARPVTRRIPVLAVTAFGRPEDEEATTAAGFRGYIRKPVDPVMLAESVAAAVASRA